MSQLLSDKVRRRMGPELSPPPPRPVSPPAKLLGLKAPPFDRSRLTPPFAASSQPKQCFALSLPSRADDRNRYGHLFGRPERHESPPPPPSPFGQQTPAANSSSAIKPTHEVKLTSRAADVRKVFSLAEGGKMLLGRASSSKGARGGLSDGRILCPVMSKEHAELRVRNGIVYVVDVGSLHGTQLNGIALSEGVEKALKDGDTLSLGKTVVKAGTQNDALVLYVSIQTMSSSIVPPLTPPTPEKTLVFAHVEIGSSEPAPETDGAERIEGAVTEPLHSPSHGRYGLPIEAAEGDLDVEILDDDSEDDEVEVVSARSRSQSIGIPPSVNIPGIEVVSVVSPESSFGAAVTAVSVTEPKEPEISLTSVSDASSEVSDIDGCRPTAVGSLPTPVFPSLVVLEDAGSELGRTDRDFRSPRPGQSSEDEPATSSCIRRLSSPYVAEFPGAVEGSNDRTADPGELASDDLFANAVDEDASAADQATDEMRDASASQHEPQIIWRQASPSDRQAALTALRLSRDRRQLSQRSASWSSKEPSPGKGAAFMVRDSSSPSAGSPSSHASLSSLSDLFPAVDIEAVPLDDDMSDDSSGDNDDDAAVEAAPAKMAESLDLKIDDNVEWLPLPSSLRIFDWIGACALDDIDATTTNGPVHPSDPIDVRSPDVNPWTASDESDAEASASPAPTTGRKRRREPEDDSSVQQAPKTPTATKTVSVQATPPELVSTATSTEAEPNGACCSPKLERVEPGVVDGVERTTSPEPAHAALTAAPASPGSELILAVPQAAVIQAEALAAIETPVDSVTPLEAAPVSPVATHQPQGIARPTKRARLGTFLVGVLAGSALSIGALASYGAGDLD